MAQKSALHFWRRHSALRVCRLRPVKQSENMPESGRALADGGGCVQNLSVLRSGPGRGSAPRDHKLGSGLAVGKRAA